MKKRKAVQVRVPQEIEQHKNTRQEKVPQKKAQHDNARQENQSQSPSKRFWFFLLGISIVCEVTATISLKMAEGFTVPLPSVITIVGYLVSFILLVRILEHMPLGLIYGIWGGVGSALTMLVGVIVWHDPFTPLTAFGLILVVVGVYFLNAGTDDIEAQKGPQ